MNYIIRALPWVAFLLFGSSLHAQTTASAQTSTAVKTPARVDNIRYFPFTVDEAALTVKVNVHDAKVNQYYTPLFKKYQYAGSVQTWEDMIEELMALNDLDFSVRNKITSDSDDDFLILTASSKEELDYFLKLVQPTFAVIGKLEHFVRDVDPKHIFDGTHRGEGYK